MNSKELKIEAPEGYEVDWDNSSNNVIRFKPIKKKVTYEDICRELFLDRPSWRLPDSGVPVQSTWTLSGNIHHSTISTSYKQLEQLLAFNKLMNVAKYLNGNWEPDFTDTIHKFYIYYNHIGLELNIEWSINWRRSIIYFKSRKLALQAIEILGEGEVKKALGIFE
jgi:hypothetical protein